MAVRHGYGKVAGTDALVFAYDTGDARNSYKGEPTENFANTDTARTLVKHDASSVMTFADAPEKGPGWKKVTITERSANNFRYAQFPYISNPGGTQRTYSVEYDAGSLTGYGWRVDGTAGYNITNFTGTGRYQMTITPGVTGVYALFLTNGSSATGINDTIYYRFYQVENNAHATQFTEGTRSSTQGLLDLTGNSTIDLANISFDSNARKVFDGTDDLMSITADGITDYSQPFTMECVFKVDSGATWDNGYRSNIFGIAGSYAGMYGLYKNNNSGVGIQVRDATTTAYAIVSSGLSKGVYYHLVGTWDGTSQLSLYLNGELAQNTTATMTGAPDTPNLYIGGLRAYGGAGGNYYQGEIPVAKYYRKALTADEVRNNYRHYKTRFDI